MGSVDNDRAADPSAVCRACGQVFVDLVPVQCSTCGYIADDSFDKETTTVTDERNVGLIHKYDVKRVNDPDGKHDDCRFFVLDPQHDPLAREALGAYANGAAAAGYGDLAVDLNAWLSRVSG